eukprot:6275457-Prymnesium_polylepis.1
MGKTRGYDAAHDTSPRPSQTNCKRFSEFGCPVRTWARRGPALQYIDVGAVRTRLYSCTGYGLFGERSMRAL